MRIECLIFDDYLIVEREFFEVISILPMIRQISVAS